VAVEAYIPTEVTYRDETVNNVFVFTLYDRESSAPRGALTTRNPLPVGAHGGPLIVRGARGGSQWRLALPEIEVINRTAMGCEFHIQGDIVREMLTDTASRSAS
jgi:hypothetical protein